RCARADEAIERLVARAFGSGERLALREDDDGARIAVDRARRTSERGRRGDRDERDRCGECRVARAGARRWPIPSSAARSGALPLEIVPGSPFFSSFHETSFVGLHRPYGSAGVELSLSSTRNHELA